MINHLRTVIKNLLIKPATNFVEMDPPIILKTTNSYMEDVGKKLLLASGIVISCGIGLLLLRRRWSTFDNLKTDLWPKWLNEQEQDKKDEPELIHAKVSLLDETQREYQIDNVLKTLHELGLEYEPLINGWIMIKGTAEQIQHLEESKTLSIIRSRI